jgi:ribosomal protein S18 acetylase RimI-like enzyme
MGVHPEFRGRGLGRAILTEAIRRLRGRGAERILVATDDFRDAAFALYESVGFSVIEQVLVYRKDWK